MEKTYAERLSELREAAGLSQQELADKASISMFTIGRIERGDTKRPSRKVAALLAETLAAELKTTAEATGLLRGEIPAAVARRPRGRPKRVTQRPAERFEIVMGSLRVSQTPEGVLIKAI